MSSREPESGGVDCGVSNRRLSSGCGGSSIPRGVVPRETGTSAAMGAKGLSRSLFRDTSLRLWYTLILLSSDSSLCVYRHVHTHVLVDIDIYMFMYMSIHTCILLLGWQQNIHSLVSQCTHHLCQKAPTSSCILFLFYALITATFITHSMFQQATNSVSALLISAMPSCRAASSASCSSSPISAPPDSRNPPWTTFSFSNLIRLRKASLSPCEYTCTCVVASIM